MDQIRKHTVQAHDADEEGYAPSSASESHQVQGT